MLNKRFNFKDVERYLLNSWKENNTFKFSNKKDLESFCILMPPPNVTGSLHMGHALTFTLQDILIRFNKKIDKNVLWQPGTDHAGIATELVVEKQLNAKTKQTKKDLGRDNFIKEIWKWKKHSGDNIVNQLNRLGASVDWSLSKFTMDEDLSTTVTQVFIELFDEGLIYKDKRLVNWDPQLQTAISDLEVVQKDIEGKMWYIKYPIQNSNDSITVATTRPETIFGDSAIAIHPKNKKLKKFINQVAVIPLADRKIKIIPDEYADPEKGTGAVKITPAHDFNDFDVGKRNDLEFINIFDRNCKLSNNTFVPKNYLGLDRFLAREKIVEDLNKNLLLEKVEINKMTIPYGERTGVVVEPYLTDQWFVDSKKLCKPIEKLISKDKIKFHPNSWIKTFRHWINNIQPWCISRQIWWGHRIPIWYSLNGHMVAAKNKNDAITKLKKIDNKAELSHQESDVLDTWFSSALWPFSTLGWPSNNEIIKRFYPTSVLVTGFDIIFFWVARMIMMGMKFMNQVPFKDIYIHPLVKDEKGNKMSKSKGNIIDPLSIIDQYGADSLRFTLANLSTQGRDIKLSNKLVENSRNFVTKLWNVARFAQYNEFNYDKKYNPLNNKIILNKWILYKYSVTKKNVVKSLKNFKFNLLINELYQFVWNDFCDLYIELSKYSIRNSDESFKAEISNNFNYIFKQVLNMINPVIPFVTEKISMELGYSSKSLYHSTLENEIEITIDEDIKNFDKIINLIKKIRFEVSEKKLNKFSLFITSKSKIKWFDDNEKLLRSIFNIENLDYKKNVVNDGNFIVVDGVKFSLFSEEKNINNKQEINKQIQFYKKEIDFFESKLNNKKFLEKAPKKVIEIQKNKLSLAIQNLRLLEKDNV